MNLLPSNDHERNLVKAALLSCLAYEGRENQSLNEAVWVSQANTNIIAVAERMGISFTAEEMRALGRTQNG